MKNEVLFIDEFLDFGVFLVALALEKSKKNFGFALIKIELISLVFVIL